MSRAGSFDSLATSANDDLNDDDTYSAVDTRQYSPVIGDDDDDDDVDLSDVADPDHEQDDDGDEDDDEGEDRDDDGDDDARLRPSAAARLAAARALAAARGGSRPPAPPPSRRRPPGASRPRGRTSRPSAGTTSSSPAGVDPELWKKAKSSKALPLKDALERIIVQAGRKDAYSFFAEPVDTNAVPMYRQIITHPMDFGTIRTRIQEDHYTTVGDFEQDLMLVFNNAMTFNPPDSPYHQFADRLARWAERAVPRETQYAITPAEQKVLDGEGKDSLAEAAPGAAALAAAQDDEAFSEDEGEEEEEDDDGPSTRAATPAANATAHKPRRSYRPRQSAATRPLVHHTHPVPLQFLPDGSIDPSCGADISLIPHKAARLGSSLVEAQTHPPKAVRQAIIAAEFASRAEQPRLRAVQAVPVENLADLPTGTGSSARTMALFPPRAGYTAPTGEKVEVVSHFENITSLHPVPLVDTEWPPLRPDARGTQPAPPKAKRKGNIPVHLPTRAAGPIPAPSKSSVAEWGLDESSLASTVPLRWPAVDPASLVLGRRPASAMAWPLSWAAVTVQPSRQLGPHDVGLGGTWIPGSTVSSLGVLPPPNSVRDQGLTDTLLEQLGAKDWAKAALALPTAPSDTVEKPTLSSAREEPWKAEAQLERAKRNQIQREAGTWTSSLAPAVPTDMTHSMWTNMYRSYRPAVASIVQTGEGASEALRAAVYGGARGEAYLRSVARFVAGAAAGVKERYGRAPEAEWDREGEDMLLAVDSDGDGPRDEHATLASPSRKRSRSVSVLSERGSKKARTSVTPQIKVEDGDTPAEATPHAAPEPEGEELKQPVPTYVSSLGLPLVTYVRDTVADPLTEGCLSVLDEVAAGFSILASGMPEEKPGEKHTEVPPQKMAQVALARAGATQEAVKRDQEEAQYWSDLNKELEGIELGPPPTGAQAVGMSRTPSAPGVAPLGLATATALAASYADPGIRMRRDELARLFATRMDVGELLKSDEELRATYVPPAQTGEKKIELPAVKGLAAPAVPPAQAELSLPLTGGGVDRASAKAALDATAKIMLDLGARRAPTEADRTLWLDQIRRTLLQTSVWGCPAADTRAPISKDLIKRLLVNPPVKKDVDAVLALAPAPARR